MGVVASEKFLNVRLDDGAKQAWDQTCEAMGMNRREAASRLVQWFCGQDESVRYAIIGPEALRRDVAETVLRRMAQQDEAAAAEEIDPPQKRRDSQRSA